MPSRAEALSLSPPCSVSLCLAPSPLDWPFNQSLRALLGRRRQVRRSALVAARIFDKNSYRERYHRYWKIPQVVDAGRGRPQVRQQITNLLLRARILRLKRQPPRGVRQGSWTRRSWQTCLKEGVTCFRLAILLRLDYSWNAQLRRSMRARRLIWPEPMTPRC